MKLVGGDSGRYEHEELVDDVILAPSERAVVDVRFDAAGEVALEHRTPERTYPLAADQPSRDEPASRRSRDGSTTLRDERRDGGRARSGSLRTSRREPDKTLAFVAEMDMGDAGGAAGRLRLPDAPGGRQRLEPGKLPEVRHEAARPTGGRADAYTCPMHPEVVGDEPGQCPKCGMKLVPAQLVAQAGGGHEHEHDARARATTTRPRPRTARRRHRVGGRHGRGQPR